MKDFPCMNDEQIQIGIKLCDTVKSHPCLYDPLSPGYQMRSAVAAAWKVVAKECVDTTANCRFRWKTIRSSFTRSFRKFGMSSQYYLYEHLDFLVPHMSLADKNDDSIGQADENNISLVAEKEDMAPQITEIIDLDSDTTKSAEETAKTKDQENTVRDLDRDNVSVNETSQVVEPQPEEFREGRPSRSRKTPKRIYEPDTSPEPQIEKRPRRIVERRKSVGGLVLREYMKQNNITLDSDGEPEIVQPLANQTLANPIEITQGKPLPRPKEAAKPLMANSSTLTDILVESADKAIQCEESPRTLDDEFLDNLRPQIKLMNFRQKINFKQRVYRALMDVLDDGKNFPSDEDDIIEVPAPMAKHFENATSGELRLMRELVSLVQAAKMSSEVVEDNNSITVLSTSSSTPPPESGDEQLNDHEGSVGAKAAGLANDKRIEANSNSPNKLINTKSTDSLGIPRHILQRAVQVTGNTGGTLLAQNGDKRRVYRIYPKPSQQLTGQASSPANATHTAALPSQGPTMGTFFVTPPKPPNKVAAPPPPAAPAPPIAIAAPSPVNNTPAPVPMRGMAIQYPKIIKSTNTTTAMLPPSSNKPPASTNGFNGSSPSAATPPKITINTHVPSANIFRRRYSICGPALTGGSPVVQNRVAPLSVKSFTPPPAAQQQQQQPQPKIQIQQQPKILLQQQLKIKQQHQMRMQQHQMQLTGIQQQPQQQQVHTTYKPPPPPAQQQASQQQVHTTTYKPVPTTYKPPPPQQQHTPQQQVHTTYKPPPPPQQQHTPQQQVHTTYKPPPPHRPQPTPQQQVHATYMPPPPPQQQTQDAPRYIQRYSFSNLTQPITSSPSQIQISKPITLNSEGQSSSVKLRTTFSQHASQLNPTNGILEGLLEGKDTPNDIPVLETAGTIAADSFDSEFPKPPIIKLEPED